MRQGPSEPRSDRWSSGEDSSLFSEDGVPAEWTDPWKALPPLPEPPPPPVQVAKLPPPPPPPPTQLRPPTPPRKSTPPSPPGNSASPVSSAATGGWVTALGVIALVVFLVQHFTGPGDASPTGLPSPSTSASPTPTIPAPIVSQPTSTALVQLAGNAATATGSSEILTLVQNHFAAINASDYSAWANTVTAGRRGSLDPDKFRVAYRSTRDSAVVINSIQAIGDSQAILYMSFTSDQDIQDAPKGLPSARVCWNVRWPVVNLGGDARLDQPSPNTTSMQAC